MQRVIVSVRLYNEAQGRDLEVPAEVESGRLAALIAQAMDWDRDVSGRHIDYQIEAHPPGRPLQSHESLASAGVWDGAWLILHPAGSVVPSRAVPGVAPTPPPLSVPQGGPVGSWRSLGIDLPPVSEQAPAPPAEEKRSSGFVWKQVD